MERQFKVLIIGAGKIGAFFDTPESENVLTHAHAFSKNQAFSLVGFVDNNLSAAQNAAILWGGKAFSSIEDAFFCFGEIDIVCVAVPDAFHYQILKQLCVLPIKVIFAEKPLTKTLQEAQEIINLCQQRSISLLVNYTRRFVPDFQMLRKKIAGGEFGNYITGTGYYGKGIAHNGSHMIDLLRFFLGEITGATPISFVHDYYSDDPSVSAIVSFAQRPFFLQYVDCSVYTIFELELLFEKARIRILHSGLMIEIYTIQENSIFHGYKNLVKTTDQKTLLYQSMHFAVEHLYKHLTQNQELLCTGMDAYRAMQVCIDLCNDLNYKKEFHETRPTICM